MNKLFFETVCPLIDTNPIQINTMPQIIDAIKLSSAYG
jgi:hypothetical protein